MLDFPRFVAGVLGGVGCGCRHVFFGRRVEGVGWCSRILWAFLLGLGWGLERLWGMRFGRRGVGWGERRVGRRFICVWGATDSVICGGLVGRC